MRPRRTSTLGCAVLIALCAWPAVTLGEAPEVRAAIAHYEDGDYPKAARRLEGALAQGLPELAERTRARLYLASAWQTMGEAARARLVVRELLREEPGATADATLFPPRLVRLIEEVRAELPAPAAPPPPARPLAEQPTIVVPPPPPLAPAAATAAPAAQVTRERPPLGYAFVPFGVGQFVNGSPKKGLLFLSTEALAFAVFGGTLAMFESKKLPGSPGPFQCTDANPCRFADESAGRLQPIYLTALYTGIALAAIGVIDAIVENRSMAAPDAPR